MGVFSRKDRIPFVQIKFFGLAVLGLFCHHIFILLMKSPTLKFIIAVVIVTLVCAALQFAWNTLAPPDQVISDGYLLLGLFAFTVTGVHLFLLSSAKDASAGFVRRFMASTTLKFMFYIMIVVVFILYTNDNKQVLLLHFLFYYAVFTILEVAMLYSAMNRMKKQQTENKAEPNS